MELNLMVTTPLTHNNMLLRFQAAAQTINQNLLTKVDQVNNLSLMIKSLMILGLTETRQL